MSEEKFSFLLDKYLEVGLPGAIYSKNVQVYKKLTNVFQTDCTISNYNQQCVTTLSYCNFTLHLFMYNDIDNISYAYLPFLHWEYVYL